MPLADAEQHRGREERAADGDQPAACARRRAAGGVATRTPTPLTSAKPSSQPAWPPSAGVEQAQRTGRAAEHVAAAVPAAGRRSGRRRGRGRCIRRSARGCCCRSCPRSTGGRPPASVRRAPATRRRRAPSQRRPRAAGAARAAARARAERSTARRATIARHDDQRDAHLRLEAQPDAHARSTSQRVRPSSSARTAHHSAATQHSTSSASGLLWREIATVIGVSREREAGHEAADAPEAPAHEVVDEHHARHAHQRLRHEHAQRVVAEDPHRQRLHPQRERRLVDRHHAARVERRVQEVVPARAHRAHGRAVVVVGPAVSRRAPTGSAAPASAISADQLGPGRLAASALDQVRRRRRATRRAGAAEAVCGAAERVCQEKLIGGASPPRVGAACESNLKFVRSDPVRSARAGRPGSLDQPSAELRRSRAATSAARTRAARPTCRGPRPERRRARRRARAARSGRAGSPARPGARRRAASRSGRTSPRRGTSASARRS